MNKITLAMALFAASTTASMAASNNTITFQGEVTGQTCSVTVNGLEANPMVLLPTVSSTDLDASGKTAGKTTFTLGVSGCTADAADVDIKTVFVGNQVSASGNLKNTGTAANVELQLLKDATTTTGIDLNSGLAQDGIVLLAGNTSAEHDFAVQYFATGQTAPGTVVASVQYAVSYL
ncbi:type 1 fimbrial protein [Yersinia mollaretii]|uniref:Fimbrial protein n=1 Tax=Yersinia mollaretii TaxID=33060 RepID=A0AA36LT35_YERMO|nr:fimbrial protein [Yersinia mollaretii]MDA5528239.1 fimbrial protein [Yersinia mollaretii]MDA5536668.1 fimbrial protein [Yersinia mollaretii]MDR7874743.1 fimbrial protein [Yersinia mollaretii]NIL04499.1 type 1 fimbrial protein [Yersinia mollaretii]PHZ30749.1 type 1 fimbrial protein [Yersinia mollaretii]